MKCLPSFWFEAGATANQLKSVRLNEVKETTLRFLLDSRQETCTILPHTQSDLLLGGLLDQSFSNGFYQN